MANRSRLRSAKPTRTDPPGSVWVACRSVAERRVDGEGRGSRAEAPPGSERRRKVRSRERTIGAQRRIEGKRTTPSLSIKSEFARTTGKPERKVGQLGGRAWSNGKSELLASVPSVVV